MSPMIDIQRQMAELGRIRTGDQVEYEAGKRRPRKLETFRLTSQSRELIEEAARLYGGEVSAWNDQWQVVIGAETLPIMLPPGEALSQWWELWSGGGCQRRCEGTGGRDVLNEVPCQCPEDKVERAQLAKAGQACKPTTRVNVILHELPGLGLWRLESHGHYAAAELAGAAEYLSMATAVGHRVPAHLRIVNRSVKRPKLDRDGRPVMKDGKPAVETRNFTVPTIDIDVRPIDLLSGAAAEPVPQLAPPAERLPQGRVNRRERVARPALPSGALPPAEANFERGTRPPLPEPPELDSAPFVPDVADLPIPDADGAIAADPGMTLEQFKARIVDVPGITRVEIAEALQARGKHLSELDDHGRGELFDELHRRHTAA